MNIKMIRRSIFITVFLSLNLILSQVAISSGINQLSLFYSLTQPSCIALSISPQNPSLIVGNKIPLTIVASFSDGSLSNVTEKASYSSNRPDIVSVDHGIINALHTGSAVLTAEFQGQKANTKVTVL